MGAAGGGVFVGWDVTQAREAEVGHAPEELGGGAAAEGVKVGE